MVETVETGAASSGLVGVLRSNQAAPIRRAIRIMRDAYRTSAVSRPQRRVVAFGAGEELVIRVASSEAEVVERLSALAQREAPSRTARKRGEHRPFVGVVQVPEFRLAPVAKRAAALRVRGTIRSDGPETVVVLRTELLLWRAAAPIASCTVAVLLLVTCRSSLGHDLYFALRYLLALGVAAFSAYVSVRVGIAHVRRTFLTALGPSQELAVADEPGELEERDVPRIEDVFDRLEAWASKDPK